MVDNHPKNNLGLAKHETDFITRLRMPFQPFQPKAILSHIYKTFPVLRDRTAFLGLLFLLRRLNLDNIAIYNVCTEFEKLLTVGKSMNMEYVSGE